MVEEVNTIKVTAVNIETELQTFFDEIFHQYHKMYSMQVYQQLRSSYIDKSLVVDFSHIVEKNFDLAKKIVLSFEDYREALNNIVKAYAFRIGGEKARKYRWSFRLSNLGEYEEILSPREITTFHLNKLVVVEGLVSSATQLVAEPINLKFVCKNCGNVLYSKADIFEINYPEQCPECGAKGKRSFELIEEDSEYRDFKRIEIQELPEKNPDSLEITRLSVFLRGDLVNKVSIGDRVLVTGIVRVRKNGKREGNNSFAIYIDAVNIEQYDKALEELMPNEQELEKIREFANRPDALSLLVDSLAPNIYGHDDVKKSIVLQLFGGVEKQLSDKTVRGRIHILLIGDPSTAKSQLLNVARNVSPIGMFTSASKSTKAGLSFVSEKDMLTGRWTFRAGALIQANGGLLALDEFDKISQSDRAALYEAMEQGTVSGAKAGGPQKPLPARVSILAAANPSFGTWARNFEVVEQIDVEPALLTRFDLIWVIRDVTDKDDVERIADTVLEGSVLEGNLIPHELMRKWIYYARQNINPVLSDEAKNGIKEYFIKLKMNARDDVKLKITVRHLESLVRLAQASARLRLSETVTMKDVQVAVDLYEKMIKKLDILSGGESVLFLETGMSISQVQRNMMVMQTLKQIFKEKNKFDRYSTIRKTTKFVTIDEIHERLEKYGITPPMIKSVLEHMCQQGSVMRGGVGEYAPVD